MCIKNDLFLYVKNDYTIKIKILRTFCQILTTKSLFKFVEILFLNESSYIKPKYQSVFFLIYLYIYYFIQLKLSMHVFL